MYQNNGFHLSNSLSKQRGIATILIVVLIGLALIATSLSVMNSLRSTQEKHVAAHAVTHAQTGVWAGVEAFRQHLGAIDADALNALGNDPSAVHSIGLSQADGSPETRFGTLQVSDIAITTVGSVNRVSATVTNVNDNAQASASVGVVIDVEAPAPPASAQLPAALNFLDDLDVGGQITITTPPGTLATINVDGSARLPQLSITALQALNATGDIELSSAVTAEQIHSNEDVILSGSARAHTVLARGNVTIAQGTNGGNGTAAVIWANGDVVYSSTGYYQDPITNATLSRNIKSRSSITSTNVGGAGNDVFLAVGDININKQGPDKDGVYSEHQGTYAELESGSDIYIRNKLATVTSLSAEGNLLCPHSPAETWSDDNFSQIRVGGTIGTATTPSTMVCTEAKAKSLVPGSGVIAGDTSFVATSVAEVPPVIIPQPVVDVWAIKQFANYVIDRHLNRTRVTIYNVNGFTSGDSYYVGNYSGDYKSHLCSQVDVNGNCVVPTNATDAPGSICLGESHTTCLEYTSPNDRDTWKFDGKGMAPGIYFIDGDLILANGKNHATVLVSGNVSTSNSVVQSAVNFGAYPEVCDAIGTNMYTPAFTTRYSVQRPTNLCAGGAFNATDVGNIGIAAGGYRPSDNGVFSGGDIFLGSNTVVNGMVLAGDYLSTGGSTVVNGYVSASVQGGKRPDKENELKENTTMDLTKGSEFYEPGGAPDMSGGACTDCAAPGGGGGGNVDRASLRWSKYL